MWARSLPGKQVRQQSSARCDVLGQCWAASAAHVTTLDRYMGLAIASDMLAPQADSWCYG